MYFLSRWKMYSIPTPCEHTVPLQTPFGGEDLLFRSRIYYTEQRVAAKSVSQSGGPNLSMHYMDTLLISINTV